VQLEAHHSSIPEVVHLHPQVGKDVGRGVGQTVKNLDYSAFLGHEDAPVRGKADRHWIA
jgi:hypothetical protein